MSGEVRERIAASIQRVDGVLITADTGRLIVHWLGQLAEIARQRNGCPPVGLVEVQHKLGEELAAVTYSRQSEESCVDASGIVLSGYDPFLGTAEAAAELGISAGGVGWHCRKGNLEYRKVGRQLMISVASIEELKMQRARRKGA